MTNPIDPTEQRVREIITKYAGASSVETSPDRFSFITDQATSEIMKIVREKEADLVCSYRMSEEKDERIKELEGLVGKAPSVWRKEFEGLEEKYLERQKVAEEMYSILVALDISVKWELAPDIKKAIKDALSHYQSLNGGKHGTTS